jgi:DNA polymerase-3 subunit epsilon
VHGAICSIGVAVVLGGEVLREQHWYVDPGTRFDPRFIDIHGITPAMIEGKPKLGEAWGDIHRFIEDSIEQTRQPRLFAEMGDDGPSALFVAHNAQFDRMQIERALGAPLPFRLACTVAMSRRAFPRLERHNLKTVSAHLRIDLKHHDALSDARACALIAHRCMLEGAGA